MTMFFNRDTQAHDFSADSAYRAYLISRNQAPIVYHSGDMQWKRFCVAIRRMRNDVRRFSQRSIWRSLPTRCVGRGMSWLGSACAMRRSRHCRIAGMRHDGPLVITAGAGLANCNRPCSLSSRGALYAGTWSETS